MITGAGMSNAAIMRAFFTGARLKCTAANIMALQWYLKIAQEALNEYQRIGYAGTGVATQTQRIVQILDQLTRWGRL